MNKPVTLKDIARETGVHVSTVSRALDPNTRTSLSEDLVRRIQQTADRMGYRPNRLASGLRTRRTMTVGLVIPDITNRLFPPIVRGIESVLEPRGYASIIVNTDNQIEREAKLIDVLLERGVDGIIHAAAERSDPAVVDAIRRGVAVVTVNRQIDGESTPAVINDDAGGIETIARLLFDHGHRRIGHIAGPQSLSTGLGRRQAFDAAAAKLGLDLDPGATVCAQRFDEEEGRRCAERLLESGGGPITAILCANDRLALGALSVLRQRGLECPGDISVTGFNDSPVLDLIPPGLTTVRVARFDAGALSARLLLQMMTEPGSMVPRTTVLPVALVERGSVGPARMA